MPVLPDDGSRSVAPGREQSRLLGVLDHGERRPVLHRTARVLALELDVYLNGRVGLSADTSTIGVFPIRSRMLS